MWVLAAILGAVTLVLFDPTLVKRLILLLVAGYKAGCRCVHMQYSTHHSIRVTMHARWSPTAPHTWGSWRSTKTLC
jgi:hypothetical protein